MPRTRNPFHPGPPCSPPLLLLCPCVCVFVCFPPHPFLGQRQLWTHTGPFSWIALAVASVTTAPRESGGTSQHPSAWALFPPPLGVVLGCGAVGGSCHSSALLGPPLQPAVPLPKHTDFPSHLFLGKWCWLQLPPCSWQWRQLWTPARTFPWIAIAAAGAVPRGDGVWCACGT
jgi:hypothetical protein